MPNAGDAKKPRPTLADQHWRASLRGRKVEDATKDMEDAIRTGNQWRFDMLMQLGADWPRREWLLREAVEHGRMNMFVALAGGDKDWQRGVNMDSLASSAAEHGQLDFVKLFVETYKVNIHYYSDEMLRTAASHGRADVVEYLVSKGADVEAWSGDPLKNACDNGHLDVVKKLVEAGAKIKDGDPLERAARSGHVAVVEYLLDKGADPAVGDYYAFVDSCRHGKKEVVEALLKHGVPANARDSEGFIAAAGEKAFDIATLLLQKGADVNAQEGAALRGAAWRGEKDVIKFLVDAGADVNAHNARETPLSEAVRSGRTDVVKLLMKHGADPALLAHAAWHATPSYQKRDRAMTRVLLDGEKAARARHAKARLAEFKTAFPGDYTVDDLREKKGASGASGLLVAAQSGHFAELLRGAKGGYLAPSDLFHPDEGLDTVMTSLNKTKNLQQFFDPALWVDRTGPVLDAYDSLPAALQKRVQLDSIRAQINHRTIMQKAKEFDNGLKGGGKPLKVPRLPKSPPKSPPGP